MLTRIATAVALLALSGCAHDPPMTAQQAAATKAESHAVAILPLARVCRVESKSWPMAYNAVENTNVTVSNDGGRCSMKEYQGGAYAWHEAAVLALPTHGIAGIDAKRHDFTYLLYAPTAGYVGADEFKVRVEPNHELIDVHVKVVPISAPIDAGG